MLCRESCLNVGDLDGLRRTPGHRRFAMSTEVRHAGAGDDRPGGGDAAGGAGGLGAAGGATPGRNVP